MDFIANKVDLNNLCRRNFNLICSGTGTGKTWYIANEFKDYIKQYGVKPHEILFIASRSLIVEQQSRVQGISKYNKSNLLFIKHWNGQLDSTSILEQNKIIIMTYDKIIDILAKKNIEGLETLNRIKVIVFDECHTLFSDKFIKDIEMLKVWIRDQLYEGKKFFIGLTATPNIVAYYQKQWGVTINKLNKEILINYKAKQLHCTDFKTIPYIIATKLEGKTLVMCYSYSDCLKLKENIPNATILLSKSNKNFTDEMDKIRKYIIENESIPDTFIDTDGVEKELDTLITTSTLREGVNLREDSGVKNIICCFTDELHITQFMGRCRYSIDNLIIADTYINADNYDKDNYLAKCRKSYQLFIENKNNVQWFNNIAHLVSHDIYDVKRFILNADEKKFIDYINRKWLVPKGIFGEELDRYKIYKEQDKQEIINMVVKCNLLKLYYSQITFNKVVNLMINDLGYTVETKRGRFNKEQHTYKLIIDFEEEKINIKNTDVEDKQ